MMTGGLSEKLVVCSVGLGLGLRIRLQSGEGLRVERKDRARRCRRDSEDTRVMWLDSGVERLMEEREEKAACG